MESSDGNGTIKFVCFCDDRKLNTTCERKSSSLAAVFTCMYTLRQHRNTISGQYKFKVCKQSYYMGKDHECYPCAGIRIRKKVYGL